MSISVFDIFSVGLGPSSSHTVGPMRAAKLFVGLLESQMDKVARIQVTLYGSLALTGKGHGTDKALLAGLEGLDPETASPEAVIARRDAIVEDKEIQLLGDNVIGFDYEQDIIFNKFSELDYHPNGMRFIAFAEDGQLLLEKDMYSVGGGFIADALQAKADSIDTHTTTQPYPFSNAAELLQQCWQHRISISDLMLANECVWRQEAEVRSQLLEIAEVMFACIDAGCSKSGILAGGLNVRRRAKALHDKLIKQGRPGPGHPQAMNWMSLYAMAVNEENAAGGRVVTAPTNGAAGIIPAVLRYHQDFIQGANDEHIVEYLLTAGAIGIIYKLNASISGAEMGCQGEVGVACSMAAGALAAILGGSVKQVEHAAEMGMEHNLGLTCDPVGGLVQIPCIERNAMGAVRAINAANLAIIEDGEHRVSLDDVIKTMYEVGCNMHSMYKETAKGGLATTVNIVEC